MFDRAVGVLLAGVLGGVVFYLHAIQAGGFYPFLWPIVAGAVAIRLADHHQPGATAAARAVMGSLTGCTAAVTFLALALTTSGFIGGVMAAGESAPTASGEPLNTMIISTVFIPSAALGALSMRVVRASGPSPSASAG